MEYDQCYKCEYLERFISVSFKGDMKECKSHIAEREAMCLVGFVPSPCINFKLSENYRLSDQGILEFIENKNW